MADDPAEFARQARALAKAMRTLPKEIRSELKAEVKEKVAQPLAQKVAEASRGKWAGPLSKAVKVRSADDPTIVVGGTQRLVSGGATGRQLIFGTEFGGGNRVSTVNRKPGRRGRVARGERGANGRGVYRRRTTKQFNPASPFVFETVRRYEPWAVEQFADIVMRKIQNVLPD